MCTRVARAVAIALAVTLVGVSAFAVPLAGEPFPRVVAPDLNGQVRSTEELVGRRALVIAITDRGAAEAMRAWYAAAEERVPASVNRESLVSLHLPFFISTGRVRDKAREQVPGRYWANTLLDRGDMAKGLALPGDKIPYVFVLDEKGRVLAAVHAIVGSPQAEDVWRALTPAAKGD